MIYAAFFLLCLLFAYTFEISNLPKASKDIDNVKGLLIWILLLTLILLASLRDITIGGDTANYLRDYNRTPELDTLTKSYFKSSRFQPGWIYLVSFVKTFFNDFNALLFIQALFVNTVIFRFFKKHTKFPLLCILLYFVSYYIEFNTEILRESIAVCICLLAYNQYLKKKYIPSILLWVLAFYFHISAVIALLFPFIGKIKYSKKAIVVLLCLGAVILLVFPFVSQYSTAIELFLQSISPSMSDRFIEYNNTEINNKLNINYYIALFAFKLILPVGILCYLKEKSNKYFGFVAVYIIFQILTAFTYGFYRFANYEAVFYIIMYADLIFTVCHKQRPIYRPLIYLFLTVITTYVLASYQLVKETDGHSYRYERYIPYKFYFEQ